MRFAATMLAAVLAMAFQAGVAEARQGAPIEFARKNALPVQNASVRTPVRSRVAATSPAATAAPLELPEMLYGYGRASARGERPALDLRGRLGPQTASALMDDDAFDDVPAAPVPAPVFTPAVASAEPQGGEGEAPAPVLVADVASQPVDAPLATAPAAVSGAYFIQVGAFANPANAERARSSLGDVGLVTVDVRAGASATLHRVRLGGWATREEAELARDRIVERGFAGAVVASAR